MKNMKAVVSISMFLALAVSMSGCSSPTAPSDAAATVPETTAEVTTAAAEAAATTEAVATTEAAAATTAQTAAAPAAETNDEVKEIAVLIEHMNTAFYPPAIAGLRCANAELAPNWELTYYDAESVQQTQNDQAENVVAGGTDGLIVAAANADASYVVSEVAAGAGIPLTNFGPMLGETDQIEAYAYVGMDHYQCGKFGGEAVVEALGGQGNVVVLRGTFGTWPDTERSRGFYDAIAEYPDIKVIAEDAANWMRDEAMVLTENWIGLYGDEIDCVFSVCDEENIGALQALKAAGMDKDVYNIGIDGSEEAYKTVAAGENLWIVAIDLPQMGYDSVAAMVKLMNGETVEREAYIDPILVKTVEEAEFNLEKYNDFLERAEAGGK